MAGVGAFFARGDKDPHRQRDVLEQELAEVGEFGGRFVLDVVPRCFGEGEAVVRREFLDARRDVDVVAVKIVAAHDDVTRVDAGAKRHPHLLRGRGVEGCYSLLEIERGEQRLAGIAKLGHDAVARGAENPTAILAAAFHDDCAPLFERGHRRFVVEPHQPRKTNSVDRHYGRELMGVLPISHGPSFTPSGQYKRTEPIRPARPRLYSPTGDRRRFGTLIFRIGDLRCRATFRKVLC